MVLLLVCLSESDWALCEIHYKGNKAKDNEGDDYKEEDKIADQEEPDQQEFIGKRKLEPWLANGASTSYSFACHDDNQIPLSRGGEVQELMRLPPIDLILAMVVVKFHATEKKKFRQLVHLLLIVSAIAMVIIKLCSIEKYRQPMHLLPIASTLAMMASIFH